MKKPRETVKRFREESGHKPPTAKARKTAPVVTHYRRVDGKGDPVGKGLCGPESNADGNTYGTNIISNVTCQPCRGLYLEDTKKKIGMVEVNAEGDIVKSYGKAVGQEDRIQLELDKDAARKKLATEEASRYTQSLGHSGRHKQGTNPMAKNSKKEAATPDTKAPEAAEPKAKRERAPAFDPAAKIKVLNKENPHREGSGRAAAFVSVLSAKTVAEYDGKPRYLAAWIESKHITVG